MFCSHCGSKVEEKDKFCPRCGQNLKPFEDKENKNTPPVVQPPRNSGCLSCLYSIFVLLAIIFLIGGLSYLGSNKQQNTTEFLIGIWLFFIVFFSLGIWGLAQTGRKNRQLREQKKSEDPNQPPVGESQGTVNGGKKKYSPLSWAISIIFSVAIIILCIYYIPKINFNGFTKESGSGSYDGYYPTTMAKPNCDSSVELTAFVVSGGEVQNPWGENAKIGPEGKATETLKAGSTPTVVEMTFTTDDKVSGSWSSGRCSGTFQGSRR